MSKTALQPSDDGKAGLFCPVVSDSSALEVLHGHQGL